MVENNIEIFTNIYENNTWGKNSSYDLSYKGTSGDGSTIQYNINYYIPCIKQFIDKYNIKKVIDLGCGDWQSSHLIYQNTNVNYIGYDAYKKICDNNNKNYPQYKFIHLDFIKDKNLLENGDLCIIKDVLQHLCNKDINDLLEYITTNNKYKYIIITNCCRQLYDNQDIKNGDWRQLTAKLKPLNKFSPKIVGYYNTKEISIIENNLI
jgi:SAM-dependent methyltransferase